MKATPHQLYRFAFQNATKPLLGIATGLLCLFGALPQAQAGVIPYPNTGKYNATTYNFTAASTGDVTAYFFGGNSAADSNNVGLLDVTTTRFSGFGLNNHSSSFGDSFDLGSVNKGDVLMFILQNTTLGKNAYSDPTLNTGYDTGPATGTTNGHNHIYSTNYTPTGTTNQIPAGTYVYVAFEDLPFPRSDYNYNDESFVFTNTSMTIATPEPSTLIASVIGGGMTLVYARRRRKV